MNADDLYIVRKPFLKYLHKSRYHLYILLGFYETDIIINYTHDGKINER